MSLSGNTYGFEFTNDLYTKIGELMAKDILENTEYTYEDLVSMVELVDDGKLVFDNMVQDYFSGYREAIADIIYDYINEAAK